ncbi:MAG TPA: stage II sporulation protein M [Candidatus Acidoferrales bacterium]|jgi:uncharacterized membrane protein SpoIIM required for sporulation|nr:stage II sporulation protein M [Candidatus Acidoferrales bacterium]
MTQTMFVERRSATWERLDGLLVRAGRKGVRALQPGEIAELGRLYRATTSDLAYAKGSGFDRVLLEYLNRMTARAHAYVYGATLESGYSRVGRFYGETLPREFRRSFVYTAICMALTVACAVVAYVLIRTHPADAYALLSSGMIPDEIKKSLHDSNFGFDRSYSPAMATQIIANNVKVAILAFGGCVTLGYFTLDIIIENGLMLGGLGALFTNAGFGYDFWATIAPHGVIELTAIQIAGGAGLLIAAGVLYPGRLRRRDAITVNAKRAGTLIVGVASMLVVAGTIEGFLSPQRWPPEVRIAIGALTAVALLFYFGFAGRRAAR